MKKILFAISFLLLATAGYSQKVEGTFTLPESERFVSVAWDWSEAIIDKKFTEKDWAAVTGEKYWEEAKQEALQLITREMNEKMDNARISVISPDSETKTAFTLLICPITYSKKGNNHSFYILKDNRNGKVIGRCRIAGDGGKIGTVANLLGDGYEEAARKMGKILKKYNRIR